METKHTNTEKKQPTASNKALYVPKPNKNRDINGVIVPECNPDNGAFFEKLSNPLSSKGN